LSETTVDVYDKGKEPTMRNLIAGIAIGIAASLTLGAATQDTGLIYRLDTQTGAVEVCTRPFFNTQPGVPIQIIQPR
jgi:hypothetical protein